MDFRLIVIMAYYENDFIKLRSSMSQLLTANRNLFNEYMPQPKIQ